MHAQIRGSSWGRGRGFQCPRAEAWTSKLSPGPHKNRVRLVSKFSSSSGGSVLTSGGNFAFSNNENTEFLANLLI